MPRNRPSSVSSRDLQEKIAKRLRNAGLAPQPMVVQGLRVYFELLKRWNRKIALTSLAVEEDRDEAIDRLLVEPIAAARYLPVSSSKVIDIGSGSGSPAIPVKLAAPGIFLRMIESKTRKAAFLREAVRELNLSAAEVETARLEHLLSRPDLHESADVVTLRAVRTDRRTFVSIQALLKPHGLLFLFRAAPLAEVGTLAPQFEWRAAYPLVGSLNSQLIVLQRLS